MKKILLFVSCVLFGMAALIFAGGTAVVKAKKYYSVNSNYCFFVVPDDGEMPCKGTLYETGYKAGLLTLWSAGLVNPVSPMNVLIPDNGKYVVTIDDIDNPGHSGQLLVIYGAGGKVVRKFELDDFVNIKEQENLYELKEGYDWFGGHKFEKNGEVFVFTIKLMGEDGGKTVKLLLKTGERTE